MLAFCSELTITELKENCARNVEKILLKSKENQGISAFPTLSTPPTTTTTTKIIIFIYLSPAGRKGNTI